MEKKFIDIFTGLKRDYGYADINSAYKDPATGKLKLKYGWAAKELLESDYIDHLNGKKSIGIQPCNDEGLAKFGAIDIDSEAYNNFNIRKYLEIIEKKNLPVVPVKSKSGGLHIYVFFNEPVKASFVRNFLDKLLFTFDLKASTEIFPKQTQLGIGSDSKPINGNFINLPYYNRNERVGINLDGTEFTFEQFLKVVESNTKTKEELENFADDLIKLELTGGSDEFADGPVCLQRLSKSKLDDYRDRFLFNYMVFAKKKYPDNWEEKVLEAARNYIVYDSVWGDEKVKQKIKAWKKDTAGHTCLEEPIYSMCVKSECLKRKFGVASDKVKKFPTLSALIKIDYSPDPEFRFTVHYNDKVEGETTQQIIARDVNYIMDQEKLRRLIGAHTPIPPPRLKNDDMQNILDNLWQGMKTEKAPPGTSPKEILHKHLDDYIHGVPAVSDASFRSGSTLIDDGYAYFVFDPFYNFLKNKEWKSKIDRTGQMMMDFFEAELRSLKRYPKKETEKKSHNPVRCVKISMRFFEREENQIEIITMKSKKDIL
mgnify:FL=1